VSRPTPHKMLIALKAACQLLLVARSCKHVEPAQGLLY
jgi:hypothetical protein